MIFFRDTTKIQNGRQRSTPIFFVGAKTQKNKGGNYSNVTTTFPTIWRCAGNFFKVLLKFKMAAMDGLHNFLWSQELKKLKSEIIHILQSLYSPSGNVQVILLKFKMATTSRLFKYL